MHNKLIVILLVSSCFFAPVSAKDVLVSSPDGAVTVAVGVKANKPYYTVNYLSKTIVTPSYLGYQLDSETIGSHVRLLGKVYATKDETWNEPWEEENGVLIEKEMDEAFAWYRKLGIRAVIYEDGAEADYESNPYEMRIRQVEVTSATVLRLRLARSGGAAIRIEGLKSIFNNSN